MPEYCTEEDKIATVTLYKDGKPFKVVVNNPPITVKCIENNPTDCNLVKVVVEAQIYNRNTGLYSTQTADNNCFAPVMGIRNNRIGTGFNIKCRGNSSYSGINTCIDLDWQGALPSYGGANNPLQPISASIKSITPITTPPSNSKKTGVQILDKNGIVKYTNPNIDCVWQVICGDECPDGKEKHKSNKYPGYCCMDCAESVNEIKAIRGILRRRSNG